MEPGRHQEVEMTKSKSPKKAPKAAPAEETTVELLITKDGIEKTSSMARMRSTR